MSIEDYWEDASVCVGGFPFSASQPKTEPGHGDSKASDSSAVDYVATALPVRSHRTFQPSGVHADFLPHEFPPPIAVRSTVFIKHGGRFVLKEVSRFLQPLSCPVLLAERRHGRLRLHLIESDEYCYQDGNYQSLTHQKLDDSNIESQTNSGLVQDDVHFMKTPEESVSTDGNMENWYTKRETPDIIANTTDMHDLQTEDLGTESIKEDNAVRHCQTVEQHSCDLSIVCNGLGTV